MKTAKEFKKAYKLLFSDVEAAIVANISRGSEGIRLKRSIQANGNPNEEVSVVTPYGVRIDNVSYQRPVKFIYLRIEDMIGILEEIEAGRYEES